MLLVEKVVYPSGACHHLLSSGEASIAIELGMQELAAGSRLIILLGNGSRRPRRDARQSGRDLEAAIRHGRWRGRYRQAVAKLVEEKLLERFCLLLVASPAAEFHVELHHRFRIRHHSSRCSQRMHRRDAQRGADAQHRCH